jgi:hypothetical protein
VVRAQVRLCPNRLDLTKAGSRPSFPGKNTKVQIRHLNKLLQLLTDEQSNLIMFLRGKLRGGFGTEGVLKMRLEEQEQLLTGPAYMSNKQKLA